MCFRSHFRLVEKAIVTSKRIQERKTEGEPVVSKPRSVCWISRNLNREQTSSFGPNASDVLGNPQVDSGSVQRSCGKLQQDRNPNPVNWCGRRQTISKKLRDVVLSANRQVFPRTSMRLVCQKFSRPLKVTRRNVEWNLLMNRWFGSRKKVTNFSDEREKFLIDVCGSIDSETSFCRISSVFLSKRLSDGKSREVTYHRLLSGQQ